jgi:hypothetical protein
VTSFSFSCCICEATTGELKPGRLREGFGVPKCSQCHAQIYWRSRQPQPQQTTTLPLYAQYAARAALASIA